MAGILTPDTIDFASYAKQTDMQQKVRPAREWVQELIDDLGIDRQEPQAYLPWEKARTLFAFRPGEVTLWAGVNGHGKSMMTGMAMLSLMAQGESVCIASFEMKPRRTLERMGRQWSGQRPVGEWMQDPAVRDTFREVYSQFRDYTDALLWMYDQQGTVRTDMVVGVVKYAAIELGVKHFVVDSLMKCVSGEDDYNAQKNFVDLLTAVARDTGIHIHLVHHLRKGNSEADIPDKSDVKGSGAIADQVDNMLLVWRNKKKEFDLAAGKKIADDEPDARLICCKQRNGEWEGRLALWYEAESQQYVAAAGAPALNMMRWPHRGAA